MVVSIGSATPLRDLLVLMAGDAIAERQPWASAAGDSDKAAFGHYRLLEDKLLAAKDDNDLPAILAEMRAELAQ